MFMKYIFITVVLIISSFNVEADGYDVIGIGSYDVKFDGSSTKQSTDFRYERRFNNTLLDIGPEEDNFFFLKPFLGLEATSDNAY